MGHATRAESWQKASCPGILNTNVLLVFKDGNIFHYILKAFENVIPKAVSF